MVSILGTYEVKLDAKGRFMFPSAYKNQMGDEAKMGFIIKRSIFKKCIELFPKDHWQKETSMVGKLNMFKKKNAEFVTKFMAGANLVELDSTGRILIPRGLLKYGGVKKEMVLTSVVNRIEIWDKTAYEQAVDYDPDDFANLAEEVMGEFETDN